MTGLPGDDPFRTINTFKSKRRKACILWQPTLYSPGYWTTDKTYFIEANAYDVETQALIWSVQSKADNPSGIEKSSKEYTEMLFAQFDKERKK